MFCSGEISPDYTEYAVKKQEPQTPGLFVLWHLSDKGCGCERQTSLVCPGLLCLPASRSSSKGRKTQPLLEQNVLIKTTDLPNFKHLLITAMPRKQNLFFLISKETQSCFLPNPCTHHCKHVSMDQQALMAGLVFLPRAVFVQNIQ